jgi:hypothetical protein
MLIPQAIVRDPACLSSTPTEQSKELLLFGSSEEVVTLTEVIVAHPD